MLYRVQRGGFLMVLALRLALILFCLVSGAQAQDTPDSTVADAAPVVADTLRAVDPGELAEIPIEHAEDLASAVDDTLAMVMLSGKKLFRVAGESVIDARTRADQIAERVLEIASSYKRRPEDIRVVRDDRIKATLVLCDNQFIVASWDYEAEVRNSTANEIAEHRAEVIRQAIIEYREDFSFRSTIRGAIIAAGSTAILIIALVVLGRWRRRFEDTVRSRLAGRTLFKVLSGESLISVATGAGRLIWFGFLIWVWLAFLNFLLSLFPWTYGFASRIFELAAGPARTLGAQALEQVPSLFFLGFITVVAFFILRGIRFIFDEIAARRLYIRGFYPDWAKPTFNIVRLVVIGFAFVVAIPYIPGSSSGAFKGMSLFVGVLVSLGSGSAMANIVSGVIMIYMRPFEIGDRVQIGDTVGDVVDRNLLTTRIRTTKNERVTIPNTNILSGQIVNFTSKRRTKELILHTSVTLGYDMPWRTIHELLIGAAGDTKEVLDDPEPFVLQKALQDFYVEYELNAYTGDPRKIPATYSELHQNIQDRFNEAGLEILSPHFRALRRGELGEGVDLPVAPDPQ
jgi:small-conductance mechanosensitive channel